MKFIKRPLFNVCECDRCGTIFQPEAGDDFCYKFDNLDPCKVEKIMTRCPVCDTYLIVTTEDGKGGE